MDKLFVKLTRVMGSTAVIAAFSGVIIYHSLTDWVYINFISELAILIGFLILRGQNVQSDKQELDIKQTKAATRLIIRKLDNGYER